MGDLCHFVLDDSSDAVMFKPQTLDLRIKRSNCITSERPLIPVEDFSGQGVPNTCTYPNGKAARFLKLSVDVKGSLGLKLFVMPNCISVSTISSGAVAEYDKMVTDDESKVRMNDFLVEVNGERSIEGMAEVLRSKPTHAVLQFFRAPLRQIVLPASGRRSGFRVRALSGHSVVYVEAISEGLVHDYNLQAPPDERIEAFDCFLGINGASGHADLMVTHLTQERTELVLLVARPPNLDTQELDL